MTPDREPLSPAARAAIADCLSAARRDGEARALFSTDALDLSLRLSVDSGSCAIVGHLHYRPPGVAVLNGEGGTPTQAARWTWVARLESSCGEGGPDSLANLIETLIPLAEVAP